MASQHVATSLLLTLPNATLTAPRYPQQQGTLSLEYLTVQVPSSTRPSLPKSEVRLILRLGSFTLPIPATQPVLHSRIKNTYIFPTARGSVVLSLAPPASTAVAEDIELFKVVLAQYGVLRPSGGETGGNRGRTGQLVLVDSDSGLVVGSLGAEFTAKEHPNLGTEGPENDPVSIEIPEEGHQLLVQPLPFEEHSKIMKTAGLLSRGIMFATSAIASGMQSATEFYVKHSEPSKEPIVFSETTRSNIRRVHEFSEQAVKMSTKTTGFVHDTVGSIADRLAKAGSPASLTTFGMRRCTTTTPSHSGKGNATGDKVPGTTYANDPSSSRRCPPPPPPRKKRPLVNRIALSTELLLTTMEKSADILLTQATKCATQGFEHKFGKDMGTAAALAGKTVKNVHVIYVDARGVGRKALLKGAGKRVIKGRLGSKEIRLSTDVLRVDGPSAKVPSVDDWHAQAQKEVQEAVKSGHRNVRGLFGRPSAA